MDTDRIIALLVGAGFLASIAVAGLPHDTHAKPQPAHICSQKQYPARVLRTVDGDTLVVMVDLGLDIYHKTKVRLVGIDTPEVYGKDRDPIRGPAATQAAQDWVRSQPGQRVLYVDHGIDKYGGRRDGQLLPLDGGPSLSETLVAGGHEK